MIQITEYFKKTYPGASIGVLIINNVKNKRESTELNIKKHELEGELRKKFEGYNRQALNNLDNNKAYSNYYKKFKKTYHVLMQLESVALKGKSVPNVDCLVEAMFMSEIKNQLLTAGHDVSKLELPIKVDVSKGEEKYVVMNGKKQLCTQDDMIMYDGKGVISSIMHGPDARTKIDLDTTHVLYVVYAPEGVKKEVVKKHLEDIKDNISIISKDFIVENLEVL